MTTTEQTYDPAERNLIDTIKMFLREGSTPDEVKSYVDAAQAEITAATAAEVYGRRDYSAEAEAMPTVNEYNEQR